LSHFANTATASFTGQVLFRDGVCHEQRSHDTFMQVALGGSPEALANANKKEARCSPACQQRL
jgi:hypothetical protein